MKTKYSLKFTARFKDKEEQKLKAVGSYYNIGSFIGTILFLIEKEYNKIKTKLN
jgi:hypothetical protein